MLQEQNMKRRMSPWGASFGSGRSSDPVAMASGPPDVMTNQEAAEVAEECSGKKKSKFQTFKNFFVRKKKKEASGDHAELKGSQSSDNVSKTSESNALSRSEKEKGSKVSLGSKALSHDSVFVSDSSEANEALGASQDSIHGKVKSLQLQLKQAIRLGSPPSLMCVKRTEDAGTMSEDDGLPCSPPEYTSSQAAMNQAQRNSSVSLEGGDSDEDQLSCVASCRTGRPLVVVPGDFSQPASPLGCLDNSAAKHKLGLRNKACNRRKPANRLEIKSEEHNGMDGSLSIPFPESLEAQEEEKRDASVDALKEKLEEEEGKKEELPLLQGVEGQELEAEQDVLLSQDTSCPSEVVTADTQPLPSPELSTRSSSLGSPRATPEPPADHEDFLDHSLVNGEEDNLDGLGDGLDLEEEDRLGEAVQGDSSFLQEVLSSLKTSCSPCVDSEDVVLEMKDENKETKDEMKDEPAFHEVAPCDVILSVQSSEEEKKDINTLTSPTLHFDVDEESEDENEKEEEEEEEEPVVEIFHQHMQLEDAPLEVKPEEQHDLHQTESNHWDEQETEASEEEQKLAGLEVVGEGHDVRLDEEVWKKQQWKEEGEEEDQEMLPDLTCQEVCNVPMLQEQREAANVISMDNAQYTHDVKIPSEVCDPIANFVHESQMSPDENDLESIASQGETTEVEDLMQTELHLEAQEEDENVDEEELLENKDETEALSFSCLPIESPSKGSETLTISPSSEVGPSIETITQETTVPTETLILHPEIITPTETIPPSDIDTSETIPNTETTVVHMNLVSPHSVSGTFAFQPSPANEDSEVACFYTTTEHHADEETTDTVIEVEEEQVTLISNKAPMPPSPEEEVINQVHECANESKVRFTIAPAWQRSLSGGETKELSSSAAIPNKEDVSIEETITKEPQVEDQMEKLVKTTVTGGPAVKPSNPVVQDPIRAQSLIAAAKEENAVVLDGNYNTPFGVRLRKTAVLHRFSSEEENTEAPVEPPAQSASCKVEVTSFKPSISQPISTKPALPKKPDVHGETGVKTKRVSEPAASGGVCAGSEGPSWISVARQKQQIYKENSLDEMSVKKEELDRKSSLPTSVSSASKMEPCIKTPESTGKVSSSELSKPSPSAKNETRKSLSPVTPVPPQPAKCQPLPCPVAPKPAPPSATSKPAPQAAPFHRSLSPPTPVPIAIKPPSSNPAKPPTEPKPAQTPNTTLTSPTFSSRINPPLPASRVPALSSPSAVPQRGLPPPSSPQDEPPWMALAKKKAKAWSEMPQIVQ